MVLPDTWLVDVRRSLKKEAKLKKKKSEAWKERKDVQRQNSKIKQKK